MKNIPFYKYTSCGNNFVIVDDTQDSYFLEHEWPEFAPQATSFSFGIGCDNLLIVQRTTPRTLDAIATTHRYWQQLPDLSSADFIFRMFEPSGEEALCCGNGLLCIADFLHTQYAVTQTKILTEIPLARPAVLSIGHNTNDTSCWVNLGFPRKAPEQLVKQHELLPFDCNIDVIDDIEIKFRRHDLKQYTQESTLTLRGYIVFTGEPHLVIFPDHDFSIPLLADYIYGQSKKGESPDCNRKNFGSWLVHRIGDYINKQYRHIFPEGISVNFARWNGHESVINRCFERGINRETLACSTGALAVSYVVKRLFSPGLSSINLLPLRCQHELPSAQIRVELQEDGWHLNTRPMCLFDGTYYMPTEEFTHNRTEEHLFNSSTQLTHQIGLKSPPLENTVHSRES